MKKSYKKYSALVLALSFNTALIACGICSGMGNTNNGLLSTRTKSYIGFFWQHNSILSSGGHHQNKPVSIDRYTLDAAFRIKDKFAISTSVPMVFYRDESDHHESIHFSQWESPKIKLHYTLVHKTQIDKNQTHWLEMNMGFSLPFNQNAKTGALDPEEIISPTTAGISTAMSYLFQSQRFGFHSDLSYTWFSKKEVQVLMGNQFAATCTGFYKIPFKGITLFPALGISFEQLDKNQLEQTLIMDSGGNAVLGNLGLDISWDNLNFKAQWSHPFSQQFNNYNRYKSKIQVGFAWSFG